MLIFESMQRANMTNILTETKSLESVFLRREVTLSFYLPHPVSDPKQLSLLLINDGQNMAELGLGPILEKLFTRQTLAPLLCVAIHAGPDRKMEYGMASMTDYNGRGARAGAYTQFVLKELLPFIKQTCQLNSFREKSFAGFSLGGLSALDIVWNHPDEFSRVGVFSGSLWWRSIDQDAGNYNDDLHRLMHQSIRQGDFYPGLKFFFQCGNMDETKDRNQNGIIDSIDDTLDLVKELVAKGYDPQKDIRYLEMEDGRHDIATWARAMPEFIKWGWSK